MSAYYQDFQTKADLDAAYDVEKSVPDFSVYARQFVRDSQNARQYLDHAANQKFGPSVAEYCDVFPAARPNAPVVIFIHGGYWRALTARDFSFAALGLVPAGCTVIVANYALCPKVELPEITRQMRALVCWAHDNARRFNGDPENLHIIGHSAGGHLAAMCALTDWKADYGLDGRVLRSILPISGLFDLEPIRHSFLQPDLRLTEATARAQSPIRLMRSVKTRMLITLGMDESDAFHRQSDDFLRAWRGAANPGQMFSQPGRNHFTAITDLMDADSPLCRAFFAFIDHRPPGPTPRMPTSAKPTWQFARTQGSHR